MEEEPVALGCFGATGDMVSLEDLQRGFTIGCFVVNESDFSREVIGSLPGLLKH